MGFQKILVALDESERDRQVFSHALELAKENRGALTIFHGLSQDSLNEPVVPLSGEMGLYPEITETVHQIRQQHLEKRQQEIKAWLQSYVDEAVSQGVPAEYEYHIGAVASHLCQFAKQWEADLIVVGRRGRSGLAEILLGSVSNYALHHAPCSVLVVQSPASEAESLDSSDTAVSADDAESAHQDSQAASSVSE